MMNYLRFHKIEVDTDAIESFIREGFESKLGKDHVLGTQLSSYPNEYIVRVTLRKETPEALDIAHELKRIFLDNNLAVGIVTLEAQA